jgi:ribosomal protein L7/L12
LVAQFVVDAIELRWPAVGSMLLVATLVLAAVVIVLAFATRRPAEVRTVAPEATGTSGSLGATWKLLRSGDAVQRVAELVRAGRKVEAIELLREASGLGLAEARDAVDDLERQLASGGPLARLLDAPPGEGETR